MAGPAVKAEPTADALPSPSTGENVVPIKSLDESKSNGSASPTSSPSPPPPSGTSTSAAPVGLIQPPPDVRVVVDRTADFVRRLGAEGEAQLIAKQRGQKKFSFLLPSSPYHAYYRQRVQHGANADAINDAAPSTVPAPPAVDAETERRQRAEAEQKAKQEAERLRLEEEARRPKTLQQRLQALIASCELDAQPPATSEAPYPASEPAFHLAPPSNYSASDLDVVNLTALYAACIGPSFLHSLTQRERSNPQFDFLKPVHPLHAYFAHTQSAYARIRDHDAALLAHYRDCAADDDPASTTGLHRLISLARWKRAKEAEDAKARAAREEESTSMAAIDWHSFVVVETIAFHPDEEAYLPPPRRTIAEMEAAIAELAIEEEREREDREARAKAAADAAAAEGPTLFHPAPAPLGPSVPAGEGVLEHVDEALEIRAAAPVVGAGGVQGVGGGAGAKLVTCVVCGDTIAAEDLEEHLRIELLDPQWKEQRQALMDRQRESSLVGGKSLSENLKRFERKKREVGRERSREEQEKQAREDALLLRGAAREQPLTAEEGDAAAPSPPASVPVAAPAPVAVPIVTVPLPPAAAPVPASAEEEPPAKRLRPASPTAPPLLSPAAATAVAAPAPYLAVVPPPSVAPAPPAAPASNQVAPPPPAKQPQPAFVPEALWLSANPPSLTLHLHVPNDPSSAFRLQGQTLSIPVQLTDSVDALKARLTAELAGLPGNRQQFQLIGGAFLKEGHSFAFYNLFDGARITLKLKERGGKKK